MIARTVRHILPACLVPALGIAAGLAASRAPEAPRSLAHGIEWLLAGADANTAGATAIFVALLLTLLGRLNWRVGTATLLCGLVLCGIDSATPSGTSPPPARLAAR